MFAGVNMFLARLRLILARAPRGLKSGLRRAKNIFMPKNFEGSIITITIITIYYYIIITIITIITIIIILEGDCSKKTTNRHEIVEERIIKLRCCHAPTLHTVISFF